MSSSRSTFPKCTLDSDPDRVSQWCPPGRSPFVWTSIAVTNSTRRVAHVAPPNAVAGGRRALTLPAAKSASIGRRPQWPTPFSVSSLSASRPHRRTSLQRRFASSSTARYLRAVVLSGSSLTPALRSRTTTSLSRKRTGLTARFPILSDVRPMDGRRSCARPSSGPD